MGGEDAPPPKAAFWILDKPLAATGKDIQRDDISKVLGEVVLFGKQTDREARLELMLTRSEDFEDKLKSVTELAGECLGAVQHERVISQVSKVTHTLSSNWRLPDDTPREHREALIAEEVREATMKRWSNTPLSVLDDKTPQEASKDPYYQLQLQAAVLLLELLGEQRGWESVDYNALRESFGLSAQEPIDPQAEPISDLPLVRLSRLQVEKLKDDDLITLFGRATLKNARHALVKLSHEVIRRESLGEEVDKARAYAALARQAKSPDEALSFYEKAADESRSHGRSPAMYLLSQLDLHIRSGHADKAQRMIEAVKAHSREPGVQETLVRILASYGLVRPDGLPRAQQDQPEEAALGDQTDSSPELWTPDSDSPDEVPAAPAKESKLWLPGSD